MDFGVRDQIAEAVAVVVTDRAISFGIIIALVVGSSVEVVEAR